MKFTKVIKAGFDSDVSEAIDIIDMIGDELRDLRKTLVYVDANQAELDDETFTQLEKDITKYVPSLNKSLSNARVLKLKIQEYEDVIYFGDKKTSIPTNLDELQ